MDILNIYFESGSNERERKIEIKPNLNCFLAPPDWTPDFPNPFSQNGVYGPEWSGFCLDEKINTKVFIQKKGLGLFTLLAHPVVDDWKYRIGGFPPV